jgi:hypothetical protein
MKKYNANNDGLQYLIAMYRKAFYLPENIKIGHCFFGAYQRKIRVLVLGSGHRKFLIIQY